MQNNLTDLSDYEVGIDLGRGSYGSRAGKLMIRGLAGQGFDYSPLGLWFPFQSGDAQVLLNPTTWLMQQLRVPEALMNVNVISPSKYEVQFFAATGSYSRGTDGLYTLTNQPFSTVIVENPDATGATSNRLRITDADNNVSEYEIIDGGIQLTTGGGANSRTTRKLTSWSATNTLRTVVTEERDSTTLISSYWRQYRTYPWGEVLVASSSGQGTNYFSYYTNGLVQTNLSSDGSWQIHFYTTNGLPAQTFSSFLNEAPTTNASLCRVVDYDYSTNIVNQGTLSGDDGTLQPDTPRSIIERIKGQIVSRRLNVVLSNQVQEIRCATTNSLWNDPTNLVTVTRRYGIGPFRDELQSVLRPDGTMEFYDYYLTDVCRTNIVTTGQPNAEKTTIVDGTQSITVLTNGQTLSRVTYDIASGVAIAYEVHSDFDEFGRARRVDYLDGTYTTTAYGCCGVSSATDRQGITTDYVYDALKRQVMSIRGGIATSNVFDAAGRTLATYRIGTNVTAIRLSGSRYDTNGWLTHVTNALGYVTSYSESGTPPTRTTTNPDNTTRVEEYARDGTLLRVSGTGMHGVRYTGDVDATDGFFTQEIKQDGGSDTSEWVKSFTDLLGHPHKTLYPDGRYSRTYYNRVGQRWKEVDPDGVVTLFIYNARGEQEYTVVDLDRNDQMNTNGVDRITRTVSYYATSTTGLPENISTPVRRSESYVWAATNDPSPTLVSTVQSTVDGRTNWQTSFGLTSRSERTTDPANRRTITRSIDPTGVYTLATNQDGRMLALFQYATNGSRLGGTTFGYDAHGRQAFVTDLRTGTTTNVFNDGDQITAVKTPAPSAIEASQVTGFTIDFMGRLVWAQLPDGAWVTNVYHATGELATNMGARTYPVAYTYDYAGRMKTLTTWTAFPSAGAAVTTWNYDSQRGWLSNKRYADNHGPDYTYTDAGRLLTRTWARGLTTTYGYDNAGALETTTYSDGATAGFTNVFDRLGHKIGTIQGGATNWVTFNASGQLIRESFGAVTVTNGYDSFARRSRVVPVSAAETALANSIYTYDNASGRLQTAWLLPPSGSYVRADYGYLTNSSLVEQIAFKQVSTERMKTTRTYDSLNRLTGIVSSNGTAGIVSSHSYQYNAANQRIRADVGGASYTSPQYWIYQYDNLGQVTSGKKYWADGTPVAGQQFGYGFDDIGNRKWAASGGNEWGTGLRYENYSANNLNQYTSRTVPGYVDLQGSASTNASVVAQSSTGVSPAYRKGDYFRAELQYDNASAPVAASNTVSGLIRGSTTNDLDIVTTNSGYLLLPQFQEAFTHDLDGNQTSDSLWTNTWNAENRLIAQENRTALPSAARAKVTWTYYPDGRWNERVVYAWTNGQYVAQSTNRFVWDGQVLLAIVDHTNGLAQSFLRGLDLSGSLQGAGGVGGVLAIHSTLSPASTHFFAYDGNGNVMALIAATNGTVTAQYDYDPFGRTLRATGSMTKVNPIRFSTQWADEVTGDGKYLFRDYEAPAGRWKSRDPIGEDGGVNLYVFCGGDAVNARDLLGHRWDVTRDGGQKAGAEPEQGDTISELADLIGLSAWEYTRWLTVPAGIPEPTSMDQPMEGCEHFEVPNTVVAYWAGWGGDVGRDFVQWNPSVNHLQSLGFSVDERHHVTGGWLALRDTFVTKSTAKELHGLYFWGHGSRPYPADSLVSHSRDLLVEFDGPGLAYGMALGLVFACDSNSGHSALASLNPHEIWHGYTGTLVPHPFHRYVVSHWIQHGDQGTH